MTWHTAHIRNSCSAIHPSKCTHTAVNTHTHTHTQQWTHTRSSGPYAATPGEQLLCSRASRRDIESGESVVHSLPPTTIPAGPRLELDYESDSLPLGHDFPQIYIYVWYSCHNNIWYICHAQFWSIQQDYVGIRKLYFLFSTHTLIDRTKDSQHVLWSC